MRRAILLLTLLAAVTAVQGQTSFVLSHGDLNQEGPPGTFFDIYVYVVNVSSQDLSLVVVRTRNSLPNANWYSSMCNDDVCYPPETDSFFVPDNFFGTPPLAPGDTLAFHLNIGSDSNLPDVAEVDIRIENQQDAADAAQVSIVATTTTTGIDPEELLLTQGFRLDANYPNPFNPGTVIPFELTRAERVSLTILNALGQTVSELLDARMSAGRYAIPWTAVDQAGHALPSGTYLARLTVGSRQAVVKMLLVR